MTFIFFLLFVSCKKDKNEDNPNSPEHEVYVAGMINDRAAYWKNGVANYLDSSNSGYSYGFCVYATDNDVYVCGGKKGDNSVQHAIYWKNGVANYLNKDAASSASSIIASGNDVYVTGSVVGSSGYEKAVYWKNGKSFYLSQDTSLTSDITISGNDVYITGNEIINGIHRATLWKNGIATHLADSTVNSYAASVSVSGNDIYIGGTERYFCMGTGDIDLVRMFN